MGIASSRIQTYEVDEHVIVECNDEVFQRLEKFAKTSKGKVIPRRGMELGILTWSFYFSFFNWYSLHTRLNNHYKTWSYKKKKKKKMTTTKESCLERIR